jgi:hypothetical protein
MMKIRLLSLTLHCQRCPITIDLDHHILIFHGPTSAGKSSIGKLINFCFGGDYVPGLAFTQELVSVTLALRINEKEAFFERQSKHSRQIQVTWQNHSGEIITVLVPIDPESSPIIGDSVYNLSDLIFFLSGIAPVKVKKSKFDENSPLVRLSFRDIFWYSYLDQIDLDSSFFNLEHPFKKLKSRDVIRFVVGLYSENLNNLEIGLEEVRKQRTGKIEAVKQVKNFLLQFGYASENQINEEVSLFQKELSELRLNSSSNRQEYLTETHFADELRTQIQELIKKLEIEESAAANLLENIDEQESLKAELLATKMKLTRVDFASPILSKVTFELCPCCGVRTNNPSYLEKGSCMLCGRQPSDSHQNTVSVNIQARNNLTLSDINTRISELDTSIQKHRGALEEQERNISLYRKEKIILDSRLNEELLQYDSVFLSQSREMERNIATLEEKLRNLEKVSQLPQAIADLEREVRELTLQEERLVQQIKQEKGSLTKADQRIKKIENYFLEALIETGIPYIDSNDKVEINRTNWMPFVLKNGTKDECLDFNSVSAGSRPLWNIEYALAVHRVSTECNLPLPNFLIIDSPMKNIGNRLDRNIVVDFYKYLYSLAEDTLSSTQFLIMDQEFIEPDNKGLDLIERLMTRDNANFPALIPYYRED